ncbi:MAG TPA: hypothetical protein ENI23_12475 [bacterium]|nr:hypothetical protein [bacterium]
MPKDKICTFCEDTIKGQARQARIRFYQNKKLIREKLCLVDEGCKILERRYKVLKVYGTSINWNMERGIRKVA